MKITMKKILFILAFSFLLSYHVDAQGIQFNKGEWKEILAKAEQENKLIFVDAYAVGYCVLASLYVAQTKTSHKPLKK